MKVKVYKKGAKVLQAMCKECMDLLYDNGEDMFKNTPRFIIDKLFPTHKDAGCGKLGHVYYAEDKHQWSYQGIVR